MWSGIPISLRIFHSSLFHVWVCFFLTCIQISQEAGKVVWHYHFLKNFPQFVMIHTVKVFSIVDETEEEIFLEFSFSMIQQMLAI